jgi:type II secretory pathway pseudopilin PulG
MKNNKKAAMFGLDARIALAIFGALSVISGAALFSAIQNAKTEQWRQYFEELNKANEAYYLDTGSTFPLQSSATGVLLGGYLLQNGAPSSTWKGPYLEGTYQASNIISDTFTAKIDSTAYIFPAVLRQNSDWTSNALFADEICVIGSADCAEWSMLYTGTNASSITKLQEVFTQLDNLVDNGDGALKGKVRYNTDNNEYLMYKGMPHKKTS